MNEDGCFKAGINRCLSYLSLTKTYRNPFNAHKDQPLKKGRKPRMKARGPEKKKRKETRDKKERRVETRSVEARGWQRLPQLLGTGWRFPGLRANLPYVDDGRSHLSITDKVLRLPRTRARSLSRSGNWAFVQPARRTSPPQVKTLWVSSS